MKIICIQQRPGIGDLILFSGFMRSIASKYNCPVSILIKTNTKADQILKNDKDFDQIIYLDRSTDKTGSHDGLGFFRLVSEIRKHKYDIKITWRIYLIFLMESKLIKGITIENIYCMVYLVSSSHQEPMYMEDVMIFLTFLRSIIMLGVVPAELPAAPKSLQEY